MHVIFIFMLDLTEKHFSDVAILAKYKSIIANNNTQLRQKLLETRTK